MAAFGVITHDHRLVADAEAGHRPGEVARGLQHPAWMAGRRRGRGEILGPIHVHGPRHVPVEVTGAHIFVEAEPAIDDAHAGIADRGRDPLGRPEELGAWQGAHECDSIRASLDARRVRKGQGARRLATAVAATLLAAACVNTTAPDVRETNTPAPSEAVSTSSPAPTPTLVPQPASAPAVSFARADLSRGTSTGVTGTGPLVLAPTGLLAGSYDVAMIAAAVGVTPKDDVVTANVATEGEIAQVVSRSPKPLTVSHNASS